LVERIGAEIDKRIDAKLSARSSRSRAPAGSPHPGNGQALALAGVAFGAGLTGVVAIIANQGEGPGIGRSIILTWLILAVICLGGVVMRQRRGRR
jgi:hypothetical protein